MAQEVKNYIVFLRSGEYMTIKAETYLVNDTRVMFTSGDRHIACFLLESVAGFTEQTALSNHCPRK